MILEASPTFGSHFKPQGFLTIYANVDIFLVVIAK